MLERENRAITVKNLSCGLPFYVVFLILFTQVW